MQNLIDEITSSMGDNEHNIWNFDSISYVARLIDKIEETKKVFMDRIDLLCKEQDETNDRIVAYEDEINKLSDEVGSLKRYNDDFGKLKTKKELRMKEELNNKDSQIEGLEAAKDHLSTQLTKSESEVQLLRLQVETMIKGDILRPQLEADLYIAKKQIERLDNQVDDYRDALDHFAYKSGRDDMRECVERLDKQHGYGDKN